MKPEHEEAVLFSDEDFKTLPIPLPPDARPSILRLFTQSFASQFKEKCQDCLLYLKPGKAGLVFRSYWDSASKLDVQINLLVELVDMVEGNAA